MRKIVRDVFTTFALVTSLVASAQAQYSRTESGSYNGIDWVAGNLLTGATNTLTGGPISDGGDPIFWPVYPRDTGVVQLRMDFGAGGQSVCSGSLLADRVSILTAAHCVSGGAGSPNPISTTVYFQPAGGLGVGTPIQTGGAQTRSVSQYSVHGSYTGDVIDHNDIAVLRLSSAAPTHATSYGLYTNPNLGYQDFTVHGYGRLGDGATGANSFTGMLRNGDNRYEFRLGDPSWGNTWPNNLGEPMSQIAHSWLSDFDSGLAANDASCLASGGGPDCNLGKGAREVGVARGDSGGPGFINGLISSVNSFGLTLDRFGGDVDNSLNASFGEFSGYVPVYLHESFIAAQMVPEPRTYALMGLGLLTVGAAARRRRQQLAS